MNDLNEGCGYYIIENDPEVLTKIQLSLSRHKFTCLGNSNTFVKVGQKLKACTPAPDIVMLGLYKETVKILNYVIAQFPKASIILLVKTGEEFEDELLSKERVNYIMV
ncbi:hypothetical protein [Echinicola vietnamensis]|uniref:Response regulatory domain-containing protein n=1 Tax=Echinicola vietnamensis (strain DSM 17526 / LMG 23754 / KMM 6221) TaxID=926556 RepID=L0G3D7_ECHVK|nr:hypothetical protein [Echinicola vietnamensis]AGA80754.1 hypothetical protein Echvi_4581 [Echinicola vietnamensis DSM 17526]